MKECYVMKTVFLCGPYNTGDKVKNIKIAIKAAQYLRDKGYNVFCPHVAIASYCTDMDDNNKTEHALIMGMCLQWVEVCDVFAAIPGCGKSPNCELEYKYALSRGKHVIYLTYEEIGLKED